MTNNPPWHVHTYAQLSSTQDYVKELAAEGLPEGTVVQALAQTKGRGRLGNEWTSPLGNLYISFILRPKRPPAEAGQISFVTAVAVSEAMDQYIGPGHVKTLKWPNDILIDGKKCAGILLESEIAKARVDWLAVGIGVNVLAPPQGRIGLQEAGGGQQVPINKFRDTMMDRFRHYYGLWLEQGFGEIRRLWLAQGHGLGGEISVRLPNRTLTGVFSDLDATGALLLDTGGRKKVVINSGEVYFQPV